MTAKLKINLFLNIHHSVTNPIKNSNKEMTNLWANKITYLMQKCPTISLIKYKFPYYFITFTVTCA